MDRDRTVAPTFVPASTSFTLTIAGGAGGNGTVYSNPTGISCTIADGEAVSGNCSAGFPRGTKVKLTATASGQASAQGVGRRRVRGFGRRRRKSLRIVRHDDGPQRGRRGQLRRPGRRGRCRHDGAVGPAVHLAGGRDQRGAACRTGGFSPTAGTITSRCCGIRRIRGPSPSCRCRRTSSAAALRFCSDGECWWRVATPGPTTSASRARYLYNLPDQSVDPGGGHAERPLVPDHHDAAQRQGAGHLGRRHGCHAQPDPGGVRARNEQVACADSGVEERALLPDDVRRAGRDGLQRRDPTRPPPS